MSHFLGYNNFPKMILLAFTVFVFLKTPAIAAGKLSLLADSSGREELVQWAGYGEEKLSTVVVSGKLLCHGGAAAKERTSNIHPSPVSGATVVVLCGTSGRTKKSWAKGSTDSSGDFLIDLPSHLHSIPNLEKICRVKVIHLPKSSPCQQACISKHKPRPIELTSIGEGIRSYTTHNIHLMPPK